MVKAGFGMKFDGPRSTLTILLASMPISTKLTAPFPPSHAIAHPSSFRAIRGDIGAATVPTTVAGTSTHDGGGAEPSGGGGLHEPPSHCASAGTHWPSTHVDDGSHGVPSQL